MRQQMLGWGGGGTGDGGYKVLAVSGDRGQVVDATLALHLRPQDATTA